MSFDRGREDLDTASAHNSVGSHNDNELPLPPKPSSSGGANSLDAETRERLDHVLQSDIGISTLLNRLKQSISSARDFAAFLKERSSLEDRHAQGLRRLGRSTFETIRRPESKGGSFAHNYEEITKIHERMAENGIQFANNLHQMHDELQDLTSNCERGRKHWKQTGLNAEKRVQDAEAVMDKAKSKYNQLAEQYDRARTGARQSGKFGLKGTKSAAQQEEDLHRKLEAADGDYASKVQAAQAQRQDLLKSHRPQAVSALQELIRESDAGLGMQLQKFASLTEKLLLGNGLCISPLKGEPNGAGPSTSGLRDVVNNIDNQGDFHDYVLGFMNKAGTRPAEIKYEKHPALSPKQQQQNRLPTDSFDPTQPSYGQPERSNTGFESYNRGQNPTQSGQISGVLPYQSSSGDRMPMAGQQGQYQPGSGPPNKKSMDSQLPQLPPVASLMMGGALDSHRTDLGSPTGTGGDSRTGPPSQTQSRPDYAPSWGPDNSFRGPTSPTGLPNQQVPMPSNEPNRSFGHGPRSDSLGGYTRPGAPPGPQGPGFSPDNRGPPMGQGGYGSAPGSRGPSLGQPGDFRSNSRDPSMGQPGDFQSHGRGPSLGPGPNDYKSENRGPSFGQPGDFQSHGRGPSLGPGPNDSNPDSRGPSFGQPGNTQSHTRGPSLGPGPNDPKPDSRGPSFGQPGDFQSHGRGPSLGPQPNDSKTDSGRPSYGLPSYQPESRGPPPPQNGNYRGPQGPAPGPLTGIGAGAAAALPEKSQRRQETLRPKQNLPPLKPVFGLPLDELFRRDGNAVPTIVSECVRAVDLFGLDVEGVYRTSGSAPHIMEMKAMFDHDATQVDFRNRAAFKDDIPSVTTLLKHFLRDLPDPLLTSTQYSPFIQAAKIDDDIVRRDSLHAIINSLPDPNYATLRVLALHLYRVAQHADKNRMTMSNLAICFGPTLMGQGGPNASGGASGNDIRDAGWQARVVETILLNTFQIFDDEE